MEPEYIIVQPGLDGAAWLGEVIDGEASPIGKIDDLLRDAAAAAGSTGAALSDEREVRRAVLAELGVCPFVEQINDGSMCRCGLPALNHDTIAARVVFADHPTIAALLARDAAAAGQDRAELAQRFARQPETTAAAESEIMEAVVLSERIDVLRDLLLQAEYRADAATAAAGQVADEDVRLHVEWHKAEVRAQQVADTVRAALRRNDDEIRHGHGANRAGRRALADELHAALDAAPPPRREGLSDELKAVMAADERHRAAGPRREAGDQQLDPNTVDLDPRQEQ